MTMSVQTQPLVSKAEAARVSGLSYSTIVRLVKRGVLPEVHIAPGMNPRLRLEDVLALGEHREQGP
jgi:excisionase family DNA binding protein